MWIWTCVAVVYGVIGYKLVPIYFDRVAAHHAKEFPLTHEAGDGLGYIAWGTFFLTMFWPLFEIGRLLQNVIIRLATKGKTNG